jgi:hypothetical protein
MNGLILLPDVFDEVAAAAQWYDEEGGQGLGDRFVACFYAYLPQIERQSEIHRKVYRISGGFFLNRFRTHFTIDTTQA